MEKIKMDIPNANELFGFQNQITKPRPLLKSKIEIHWSTVIVCALIVSIGVAILIISSNKKHKQIMSVLDEKNGSTTPLE